jgi:uncharacterized lipoprotein YddW (UPF0748 family)
LAPFNKYFCKEVQFRLKNIKPWVQFGISPFGVWRNKSVDPRVLIQSGQTNYDDLFADPIAWMEINGLITSFTIVGAWIIQSIYSKLLRWWSEIRLIPQFTLETEDYKINMILIME